jgi:glycosyltransferase involved in cell wall biosynthesis
MRKKISVCIATYNGEKYIQYQIESILKQLSIEDEIIISDDHSSDGTLSIINSFNDSRITIFLNAGEKGYTSNFENALSKAQGDYIFLSDQDDIWVENKIKCCLEYLKDYDLVVSDAEIIDNLGRLIYSSFFKWRKPYYSTIGNLYKFGFLGCCFAFKREILNMALPFPKKYILCTHDNWLFLIVACNFSYKILSEKLIKYRRHDNNISTGGLIDDTSFYFKVKYRIYLIWNLIKRKL